MDAITLNSQIMVSRDLNDRLFNPGDDFFKNQLREQIVNYMINEGLCEFDFSDPVFKKVTVTVVKPKKAN